MRRREVGIEQGIGGRLSHGYESLERDGKEKDKGSRISSADPIHQGGSPAKAICIGQKAKAVSVIDALR